MAWIFILGKATVAWGRWRKGKVERKRGEGPISSAVYSCCVIGLEKLIKKMDEHTRFCFCMNEYDDVVDEGDMLFRQSP